MNIVHFPFLVLIVYCPAHRDDFFYYYGYYLFRKMSFIIIIAWYILQQVHSLFQSEFSTECDLVLPLSVSITLLFA